ncbi:MAG: TIGR04141 family sporadically distributed protein [Clostridia bacterium]|nr:TIGR04141 family sporadically distributed protein [Clostridia bacterium]
MPKLSAETQFSIYKIDFDSVESTFDITGEKGTKEYLENIIAVIINSVCSLVRKKPSSQIQQIQFQSFSGVVFKTVHEPAWKTVAEQIIANNEIEGAEMAHGFLTNTNVSYILLCAVGSKLYACTGGYGSNYISKFVVKNYGLYLLPKLVERNNPIVKSVIQNNLVGNQASTNKVNRKTTSLSLEQDMSSVFRQLTVEAERSIVEGIGISFDESESDQKKTNLVNKDSFIVRRSLSLNELVNLLHRLSEVEERDDAFALNYMVLARKKGIKNADLFEKMVSDFAEGDLSRFMLVGDEFEQYYINSSRYIIKDNDDAILIDQVEPIDLPTVFALLSADGKKVSKTNVKIMLKQWQLSTEDNSGNITLFPISIFDALQGFVEFGETKAPCYLFNGSWYVFDNQYDALLSREYEDLFDNNKPIAESIISKWGLTHAASTEEDYNKWLSDKEGIQVAHTVLMRNIEIADAILFDESDDRTVYLLHNKALFNGEGARDLTNQILSSSEYLNMHRVSYDSTDFFADYYNKIVEKAKKENRQVTIGIDGFIARLKSSKICYVAGYLTQFKRSSDSTYAKYLSIELWRKLKAKGIDFVMVGLG